MADKLIAIRGANIDLDLGTLQALMWDGSAWNAVTIPVDISGRTDWIGNVDPVRQISAPDKLMYPGGTIQYASGQWTSDFDDYGHIYKWVSNGPVPELVRVASNLTQFDWTNGGLLTSVVDSGSGAVHLGLQQTVGHLPPGSAFTGLDRSDFAFDTVSGEITNWVPQSGGAHLMEVTSTPHLGKLRLWSYFHLFKHAGYLWTFWGRAEYTHRFASGSAKTTGWVTALTRTTLPSSGTAITHDYYRDNTVVTNIFTPYHAPTSANNFLTLATEFMQHSSIGTIGNGAVPPVYWPTEDCWFLPTAMGTLWDAGSYPYSDGDNKDWLYIMLPSGAVYPALDIKTFTYSTGLVNSGWSGGVYYHQPTNKVYAFFYTAKDIMYETAAPDYTAWLHMYRLDSYDLGASPPTFDWTLVQGDVYGFPVTDPVGTPPQAPSGLFSLTSDAENIFLCWTATNPGVIYRLHLATEVMFADTISPSGYTYPALQFARVRGPVAIIPALGAGIIG